MIVGSAAVGIIVGMLSGMLGVGGGTILVPVFRLLYGMPAIVATATSLFTIIPTSLSGVITHVRNKTCIPLLGVAAGIGGAIVSPLGVWLASVSPEWAIMVAAALVIGYSAVTMFQKAWKLRRQHADGDMGDMGTVPMSPSPGQGMVREGQRSSLQPADGDIGTVPMSPSPGQGMVREGQRNGLQPADGDIGTVPMSPPKGRMFGIGFCVGLVAGVVSGYVGVGGGFIMVPLFMQLLGTPMKMTSGTSLIAVMILAIPGTIAQAVLGNVDWLAGILIALGTIPGAAIGSRLMTRVSELALRFGFSLFLLVAATLLILNQLNIF